MAKHAFPWWLGYLLVSPIRRLGQDPGALVAPFVSEGMTVLEPGPGMGFFTLELARLVGPRGRVIAVDVQARMLEALARRARRAGLWDRIEAVVAEPGHLRLEAMRASVDFAFAMAVVHEVENAPEFFAEVFAALKPGGKLLVAEPRHVVSEADFGATKALAESVGFRVESNPAVKGSLTALFIKP